MIDEQAWSELQASDQLTTERLQEHAFEGFEEAELTFPPTYKYDLFSDEWDTSDKARCPAWTDRVLVRSSDFVIEHYGRNETLKNSDHRPVLALICTRIISEDAGLRTAVREEILEELRQTSETIAVHPFLNTMSLERLVEFFEGVGRVLFADVLNETAFVTFDKSQVRCRRRRGGGRGGWGGVGKARVREISADLFQLRSRPTSRSSTTAASSKASALPCR